MNRVSTDADEGSRISVTHFQSVSVSTDCQQSLDQQTWESQDIKHIQEKYSCLY